MAKENKYLIEMAIEIAKQHAAMKRKIKDPTIDESKMQEVPGYAKADSSVVIAIAQKLAAACAKDDQLKVYIEPSFNALNAQTVKTCQFPEKHHMDYAIMEAFKTGMQADGGKKFDKLDSVHLVSSKSLKSFGVNNDVVDSAVAAVIKCCKRRHEQAKAPQQQPVTPVAGQGGKAHRPSVMQPAQPVGTPPKTPAELGQNPVATPAGVGAASSGERGAALSSAAMPSVPQQQPVIPQQPAHHARGKSTVPGSVLPGVLPAGGYKPALSEQEAAVMRAKSEAAAAAQQASAERIKQEAERVKAEEAAKAEAKAEETRKEALKAKLAKSGAINVGGGSGSYGQQVQTPGDPQNHTK